jgi:hypothetical protein
MVTHPAYPYRVPDSGWYHVQIIALLEKDLFCFTDIQIGRGTCNFILPEHRLDQDLKTEAC